MENSYVLQYLSLFYDDLEDISDYITFQLGNADAAHRFVNDGDSEKAISYFILCGKGL